MIPGIQPDRPPCLGPEAEDFRVVELPAYAFSGEGEHLFVRLRKTGRTTPELLRALAKASGVRERDIGCAGLKDRHAVTEQWFSLSAREAGPPEAWALPGWCELVEATRHGNKLRTGHLSGNQFEIRLVGVAAGAAADAAIAAACERLSSKGFLNLYDAQRFGRDGRNLADALAWLGGREVRDRRHRKFLASVVQSEIFNRYAVARRERGMEALLLGEVVRLEGSSAVFVVEDPSAENPRLAAGDIHLTGPMIGPKMREATGAAAELEIEAARQVLATVQPSATHRAGDSAAVEGLGYPSVDLGPGTRRDLVVRPAGLGWQRVGEDAVRLSFKLPPGAYATRVVTELTGEPVGSRG